MGTTGDQHPSSKNVKFGNMLAALPRRTRKR
jgi:hypothetical protein